MIICCGDTLIDMLPTQMADGQNVFIPAPGGALFNTAICLGRLNISAGLLSGLSTDLMGDILRQSLRKNSVDFSYSLHVDRPTTLAFVKLHQGKATYNFYDEATASRLLSDSDIPELGSHVTALHFGAISLVSEPCGTAFEHLFMRERGRRILSIDLNIRPQFIKDRQSHLARLERMIKHADIVKCSDDDLAWVDNARPPEDVAKRWAEDTSKLVIMTTGVRGAVAYYGGYELAVPARRVKVVDTVGAGDAFNAGLLTSLYKQNKLHKRTMHSLQKCEVEQALEFGVRLATLTVSHKGAYAPDHVQLETVLDKV